MDCPALCVKVLFLLTCLRCGRAGCSEIVNVTLSIKEHSSDHGACSPSNANSNHLLCPDFQSALDLLANSSLSKCWDASIVLRLGQNVIENQVYLSTYSLVLIGSGPATTIVCEKFECESTAGQHSIYFNRSHSVRIANLSSEGCPCPFRFDRVMNVSVRGSSFRFARDMEGSTFRALFVTVYYAIFKAALHIINTQIYQTLNKGTLTVFHRRMRPVILYKYIA